MSENKLVGSLVLRTIDIDPTKGQPCIVGGTAYDNNYGLCTANGCFVTWKNVNIKSCIGELYNKYDKFNLKLTAVQLRHSSVTVTDAQFMIYMSGLPFINGSTYNTRHGPTNSSALGCVNFIASTSVGSTIPIISGLASFDKPRQDKVNISIELKNSAGTIVNGYTEKPTSNIGHWSVMCDIYGVDN